MDLSSSIRAVGLNISQESESDLIFKQNFID